MTESSWIEEYQDHQAWVAIDETIQLCSDYRGDNHDEQKQVDRVRLVFRAVSQLRDSATPLISSTSLEELHSAASSVKGSLEHWVQHNNPSYLDQAYSSLATVQDAVRGWPVSSGQTLRSAAATLRESVKASNDHLVSVAEDVTKAKTDLQSQALETSQQLSEQEAAILARFQELGSEIATAASEIQRVESRVDTIVTQQQTRFTDAEEERLEKNRENVTAQQSAFEEAITKAIAESEKKLVAQETTGKAILSRIEELRNDVEAVVGAVGTASTANWYRDHATEQRTNADTWRLIAVAGFIMAFVVIAWSVYIADTNEDSWRTTLLKTTTTATLVAGAIYATTESRRHRKAEFTSKKTELTLRALDPFIATLDDADRDQLKIDTTRHIFMMTDQSLPVVEDDEYVEDGAQA